MELQLREMCYRMGEIGGVEEISISSLMFTDVSLATAILLQST